MVRINLLPWREIRRKERERQFYSILAGSAVLMGAIVLYVHLHINGLISEQNNRNAFIEGEIAVVEKQIKEIEQLEAEKARLLARMDVIQKLQSSRPVVVHLLDEVVNTLPEGVYLTNLTQKGDVITLKGIAQSNARVSAFMRNIDKSEWLTDPKLNVIQTNKKGRQRSSDFTLVVKQLEKKKEDLKKG
ncbi:MAG: PilN domain-containing protein [Gammaproteobacteria bacterium]|nr:PilN domain-containing protein [Gammaproteobacteria bacterium]MDH5593643.1 PilN domain-containing protein [Gammaproteobacteria bacterium]